MAKKTYKYSVCGIDCADCAAKIEHNIAGINGISDVSLDFMNSRLTYTADETDGPAIEKKMRDIVHDEEDEAVVTSLNTKTYTFKVEDIDCADCAAKIEHSIAGIEGISDVSLDFMNSRLTYRADPRDAARIEKEMRQIVKNEEEDARVSASEEKAVEEAEEDEGRHMPARIISGAVLFVLSFVFKGNVSFVLALAAYLILGYDVIIRAFKGIGHGRLFDENFLMTVATFAAVYLGDMKEACGVMLFYQIGEYFQDLAVEKSRKSIGDLMDIRPDHAVVSRDGEWVSTDPQEVSVGDLIQVSPGERVPLDGVVVKGSSSLNTSSLTGESKPRDVDVNDEVISGAINETGVLEIRVTKEYGESTATKILELVENADGHKAKAEHFITKFSRYYTPIVVFSAIAVAIAVGIATGNWNDGVYRACTFLVISCPCALVISIPLSFFSGIGGLSSRGVLVKGADLVETLAKVKQVVMDKTGTLTNGTFTADKVTGDRDTVLFDAAAAESHSSHPIAIGIRNANNAAVDTEKLSDVKEIAGRGLSVNYDEHIILAGNARLMRDSGIEFTEEKTPETVVYVAKDGIYEGAVLLKDTLKKNAAASIADMKAEGIHTVMLSGDNPELTQQAAQELGVDEAWGGCLPQDKVQKVLDLKKNGVTAFVGDGVNDAPVLANADIGMAMGALGSDAAIEAADVVLMDDDPAKITLAVKASRRILRTARQNIYFAIIVKIVTLILGAFGIANMWMAIFADTGVAMLCVLNSLRLLRISRKA